MTVDELAKKFPDWWLQFTCVNGKWEASADAGDSNCPYAKEFDPKDGHGYSTVETSHDYATSEDCAEDLAELIAEIRPGEKYPAKVEVVK